MKKRTDKAGTFNVHIRAMGNKDLIDVEHNISVGS